MTGEERLRLASRKLIEAHEAERTQVAAALHDDIGQRMAILTMALDGLVRDLPLEISDARHRLRELSDQTLALAREIQALSHHLHPSRLDHLGLAAASASFCREIAARRGVEIAFSHNGIPGGVPADVALALFRVLQEAVTNAIAHAGVGQLTVILRGAPDGIHLDVVDAGIGFDVDAALSGRGVGLIGMQERARLTGGELLIESRPGAGTSIRVRAPIARP